MKLTYIYDQNYEMYFRIIDEDITGYKTVDYAGNSHNIINMGNQYSKPYKSQMLVTEFTIPDIKNMELSLKLILMIMNTPIALNGTTVTNHSPIGLTQNMLL